MKVTFQALIVEGMVQPCERGRVAAQLAKFGPGLVTVTVEREPKRRTLRQNARYWDLIVPAFSEWTGYEQFPESAEMIAATPKDSAHEILKAMFVPAQEVTLPDGSVVFARPSTARLSVAQFSDLQDKAERFLNSQGIYLPAQESH